MFSRSRAHADARVLTLLVLPLLAGATFLPAVAGASTFRPSNADSLVPVTISFRATVGTKPFACGTTYQEVGTSRASITASDFRLYVHDIRLINARGDTVRANLRDEAPWQNADVALLDFEDGTTTCSNGTPETRDVVVVMAPPGRYRGVAFTVGVPFERNHLDVAQSPPPLTLSRLYWSWTGGYKFMRVDMRATAGDSTATPWVIHLGSTGCTPNASATTAVASCTNPNRAQVVLDGFDPSTNVVAADLGALLARSDVRKNQPKTAAGCMSADSDTDCGGLFGSLGLPHSASTGSDSPKFFRVIRAESRVGSRP